MIKGAMYLAGAMEMDLHEPPEVIFMNGVWLAQAKVGIANQDTD